MHKNTGIVPLNDLKQALLTDHKMNQEEGKHDAAYRHEVESGLHERLNGRAALNIKAPVLVSVFSYIQLDVRFPNSGDFYFWACQIFIRLIMCNVFVIATELFEEFAIKLSNSLKACKASFVKLT